MGLSKLKPITKAITKQLHQMGTHLRKCNNHFTISEKEILERQTVG